MTKLESICLEINSFSPDGALAVGPGLINDYIAKQSLAIKIKDISDKLEPHLSEKVKGFWKNIISSDDPRNETGLLPCYMGITVERTIAATGGDIQEAVTHGEYIAFAELINWAAKLGAIEGGSLMPPFELPLAILSMSRRTMLCFYTGSYVRLELLRKISNVFCNEGELPPLLQEIVTF